MQLPDPIQPGLYPDVADADYRKAPGISVTALKEMRRSAAHYKQRLQEPPIPSKAMLWGTAGHHLLLTPQAPHTWVVKPDDFDGRSKDGRAWLEENRGKPMLDADEWRDVQAAVEAAKAHSAVALAIDGARAELSAFAPFETAHGMVLRKGRIDVDAPGVALADFKFVEDASEEAFARMAADFRYYMQAAYYLDLYNSVLPDGAEPKEAFVFIAVEKSAPFACNCWLLHPEDIRRGRAEYEHYLEIVARSNRENDWTAYHPLSSYSKGIRTLCLPAYARKRLDERALS